MDYLYISEIDIFDFESLKYQLLMDNKGFGFNESVKTKNPMIQFIAPNNLLIADTNESFCYEFSKPFGLKEVNK